MSKLSWSEDTEAILNDLQKHEREINEKRVDLRKRLSALDEEHRQLTSLIRTKLPHEIPAEIFYGSKATITISSSFQRYDLVLSIENEKAYKLSARLEANHGTPKVVDSFGEELYLSRGLLTRNTSIKTLEIKFNLSEFSRMLNLIKFLKLNIQESIQNFVDKIDSQIKIREEVKKAVLELRKK